MNAQGLKEATLTKPVSDEDMEPIAPSYQDSDFEPVNQGISKTESALRGAAQGATLNWQPALSGNMEAAMGAGQSLLTGDNAFGDEGHFAGLRNYLQNYQRARDTQVGQKEAAQKENPGSFLTGDLIGSVPMAIATSGLGAPAEGASYLSKLGNAAKVGAAYGGISGAGASKADLVNGEIPEFTSDVAKNAALGAGTGAAFQSVVGALPTAKGASDLANQLRAASLGGTKSQIQKLQDSGLLNDLGNEMKSGGAIKGLPSREEIQENLEKNLQKYGEQIGEMVGGDRAVPADDLIAKMRANVQAPLENGAAASIKRRAVKEVTDTIDAIEAQHGGKDLSLQDLQDIKKAIADETGAFDSANQKASAQGYRDLYGTVNQHIEDSLEKATGPENLAKFQAAKKGYSLTNRALDMVEGKNAREFANRAISPSDYATGAATAIATAAHHVNPILSLLAAGTSAAANKGLRKYGNQLGASGLDALSGVLNYVPGSQNAISPVISRVGAQMSPWMLNTGEK